MIIRIVSITSGYSSKITVHGPQWKCPAGSVLRWTCAAAGFDAYPPLDSVEGDSADSHHSNWIHIEAFARPKKARSNFLLKI